MVNLYSGFSVWHQQQKMFQKYKFHEYKIDIISRLLVQIHDELLFEIPDELLSRAGGEILSIIKWKKNSIHMDPYRPIETIALSLPL